MIDSDTLSNRGFTVAPGLIGPEECRALAIPYIFDPGQQCVRMSGDEGLPQEAGHLVVRERVRRLECRSGERDQIQGCVLTRVAAERQLQERFRKLMQAGVDRVQLQTHVPYGVALRRAFAERARRLKR